MREADVELVRRVYEAQARGDLEGMLALLHEDVEWDVSRRVFDPDVYRGHAGFRAFIERQGTVWEQQRLVPERFIASGDRVVVAVRIESTGRHSSAPVTARTAHVWEVRGGKAVRMTMYQSLDDALADLGISDAASPER